MPEGNRWLDRGGPAMLVPSFSSQPDRLATGGSGGPEGLPYNSRGVRSYKIVGAREAGRFIQGEKQDSSRYPYITIYIWNTGRSSGGRL